MSVRNHSQSLQNDSGKLNLVVRDEGTANIYSNTKTLRFEPEGCIVYGPGSREITINTASTGGGGVPAGDIVWEKGGVPSSIIPKFSTGVANTAGGINAVAHGSGNSAASLNSYTGGGNTNSVGSGADNGAIIGGNNNTLAITAGNSVILGGATNTVNNLGAIITGTDNFVTGGTTNNVILGGTGLHTATNDTVYACNNLEVGNIGNASGTPVAPTTGKILRISATLTPNGGPGVGWEDGNCGNSTELWFTAADFQMSFSTGATSADPVIAPPQPFLYLGNSDSDPVYIFGVPRSPYSSVVHGVQPQPQGQWLVGQKLLPKGFKVEGEITWYFTPSTTGNIQWVDDLSASINTLTSGSVVESLLATGGPGVNLTPNTASMSVNFPGSGPVAGLGNQSVIIGLFTRGLPVGIVAGEELLISCMVPLVRV